MNDERLPETIAHLRWKFTALMGDRSRRIKLKLHLCGWPMPANEVDYLLEMADLGFSAADTIARLRSENQRLREGLEPFAQAADMSDLGAREFITRADLRRAKTLLQEQTDDEG